MTLEHPDPLANPWFNKSAFSVPASYQFGTAARSYAEMRAPNSYNESFGLMRRIKLLEKASLRCAANSSTPSTGWSSARR